MSVGYPVTKTDLDNRIGQQIVALRAAFSDIVALKAILDDANGLPDSVLTGLSYQASEISLLRAAYTDLVNLWLTSTAARTQPGASDFWLNAKRLAGLNYK